METRKELDFFDSLKIALTIAATGPGKRFNILPSKSRSIRIKNYSFVIDRIMPPTSRFRQCSCAIDFSISRFQFHRLAGLIADIGSRWSAAKSPSTGHIYQIVAEYKFLFTYHRRNGAFRLKNPLRPARFDTRVAKIVVSTRVVLFRFISTGYTRR